MAGNADAGAATGGGGFRTTSADGNGKRGIRLILADPALRTVMLIVFVIMLGFGIVLPILPLYAQSFGVGYDGAGLLISSFAFTRLLFDVFAGRIVDRYGERLSMSVGVVFVGVTSALLAFAPNYTLAVVFRGAGGAGSAVLFAALFSYVMKVVPKDRIARTFSVFFGFFNLGIIAGAPVGGVVADLLGLRAPVLVYAILLLISGVLYLRFVSDPPRAAAAEGPTDGTWAAIRGLLRQRAYVTAVVVNFAYLWMIAAVFDTLMPLFAKDGLGMSPLGIGGVLAVVVVTEFAVLYHAGTLADRLGRRKVLLPAMTALGVITAVQGLSPNVLTLVILMGLLGFASGYAGVVPSSMLSDVAPDERKGTAIGVQRFFGDVGFVLGPATAGFAAHAWGFVAAFALVSIPSFAAVLLAIGTPETLRREDSGVEPAAVAATVDQA